MNEEELRNKIADFLFETNTNIINQIIRAVEEHRTFLTDDKQYYYIMADALIAAGIGDLKEAEHRAAIAERALLIACGNMVRELWQDNKCEWRIRNYYDDMIKQAEKELAEERKDD